MITCWPEDERVVKQVLYIANEAAMIAMGIEISHALHSGDIVLLEGNLGAGKTTLTRGILQAFGWQGAVKSPTYTIVEPYEQLATPVYHFDLYRLGGWDELEAMGYRDYIRADSIVLIEWPQRVRALATMATVIIQIDYANAGRQVSIHRVAGVVS